MLAGNKFLTDFIWMISKEKFKYRVSEQANPVTTYAIFHYTGEHCEPYVKRFELLFGSSRSGISQGNGGIN